MFTICWMASSCPTIIRRSPVSSCVASLPVLAGSNGMLSRTIFSTAFRLGGTVCLGSPLHKLSGNPSAISMDAPNPVRIRPHFYHFLNHFRLLAFRSCRANFHPAYQRSFGQAKQHMYYFGNVLRPNFPICTFHLVTAKSRGNASRHDSTNPHILTPHILHHRVSETRQPKFRSVISSSSGKCMGTCQATYIDDVTSAFSSKPEQ